MDNVQIRNKIIELRKEGFGYKKIAKELNMTVSAVRYAVTKIEDEEHLLGKCKNCGIEIKFIKGKKKKIFCSDNCRSKWWSKNPEKVNRKAYYTFICKFCQKEHSVYGNKNRVYYSGECYRNSQRLKEQTDDGKK